MSAIQPTPPAPTQLPFSLNIDPAAVNQVVANAIINSAIGTELKKSIDEAVKKIVHGDGLYNRNPIRDIIETHIRRQVADILDTPEYKEPIKAKVVEAIAAQATDELIQNVVKRALSNNS